MKTLLICLLCLVCSLTFAQGKKLKTPKSTKADSSAVKDIQWNPQTGKFLYPASLPDSARITRLEGIVNGLAGTLQQSAKEHQEYVGALKLTHQHDVAELQAAIQQLRQQQQPVAGPPKQP